jgi:hypothetical protein
MMLALAFLAIYAVVGAACLLAALIFAAGNGQTITKLGMFFVWTCWPYFAYIAFF